MIFYLHIISHGRKTGKQYLHAEYMMFFNRLLLTVDVLLYYGVQKLNESTNTNSMPILRCNDCNRHLFFLTKELLLFNISYMFISDTY